MTYLKDQLFTYDVNGLPLYLAEIVGLSSDTKPTEGLVSGSTFTEVDTGVEFILDAESEPAAWTEKVVTTATASSE